MPEIYTVFDTETTGLTPEKGDRIVEIAALQIIDGKISHEEFVTLVNPEKPIPFEASKVNGITDEMLRNAPKIKEILPHFMEFVSNSTIVAHNAKFDMRFLGAELKNCGINTPLPKTICTVNLSRKLFPYQQYHNLDDVCFRLGIDIDEKNRHRAMTDVILTARVFMKLMEIKKNVVRKS